jgi:hypothetical protein
MCDSTGLRAVMIVKTIIAIRSKTPKPIITGRFRGLRNRERSTNGTIARIPKKTTVA